MNAICSSPLLRRAALIVGCGCLIALRSGQAEDRPAEPAVAATVNGDPILVSEVERDLRIALGDRPIAAAVEPYVQDQTLAQLIDRRLIVQWLRATGQGASESEIDLEISRLEKRLLASERTLAEHLAAQRITVAEMRRLIEWQLAWRKLLTRYLTDANLERYFNDHRRDFDGTRLHVAHILFEVTSDDEAVVSQVIQRAAEIRESIVSGALSFEEAAKAHSAAPTGVDGGDIGFIERHRPMHETFSRAAFALNELEISQPVRTPFGVHLIRCLAMERGQRTWQDARAKLTTAITRYLFRWAADKQRPGAEIQFSKP